MAIAHLVGYQDTAQEQQEMDPSQKNEGELLKRMSTDANLDEQSVSRLLKPVGDPNADRLAKIISEGLRLKPIHFRPVELNGSSYCAGRNLSLSVQDALAQEGITPSAEDHLLILSSRSVIAEVLGVEIEGIEEGEARPSNILSGATPERELMDG